MPRLPARPGAYEELLGRYAVPLRRLAHAYARSAAERDDLFQDIALALWTALPGFRGEASERTWLYRIAHNTAIRFATKRLRRSRHEQPGDAPDPVSRANPERTAIDDQQRRLLWEAVRALPLADRQIVILHLEGLSAADIMGITGLSAANVATRLTRIRKKLTAHLRDGERR
jgi:RNA polymerase sigma-70 factor (ECF subfamily)